MQSQMRNNMGMVQSHQNQSNAMHQQYAKLNNFLDNEGGMNLDTNKMMGS